MVEVGEEVPKPMDSLHDMLGIGDSQTTRLQGRIKNTPMVILVDSSSSHNFMDQTIAKRTRCHAQAKSGVGISIAMGVRGGE